MKEAHDRSEDREPELKLYATAELQVDNYRFLGTYDQMAEALEAAAKIPGSEIWKHGVLIHRHNTASGLVGKGDWSKTAGWSVWIPLPKHLSSPDWPATQKD